MLIGKKIGKNHLGGGTRLFGVIAFLAAGYAIAARGLPSSGDGDYVVEREILTADFPMTIVANTGGDFRSPPVRIAELTRLFALAFDMRRVAPNVYPVFHGANYITTEVRK